MRRVLSEILTLILPTPASPAAVTTTPATSGDEPEKVLATKTIQVTIEGDDVTPNRRPGRG